MARKKESVVNKVLEAPLKLGFSIGSSIVKAFGGKPESYERAKEKPSGKVITTVGKVATAAAIGLAGAAAAPVIIQAAPRIIQAAPKIAKAVIPSTPKGKIIAAVAAPVVVGAIARQPKETIQAISKAPSELAQFGGDIAQFAANPSIETAKEIVKESPVLSAAAAAAGVAAVGGAAAGAVSSYLTRQEMEKQTEAFERQAAATEEILKQPTIQPLPYSSSSGEQITLKEKAAGSPSEQPTGQEYVTISTKKRKRRARQKDFSRVNQSVRVNVINSNRAIGTQIKRYLKQVAYA